MKNKIFAGVFALLLLALSVLTLALPKKEFSETENRTLASFPEMSRENLLSGKLTADAADYLADHYVVRDLFVSVHSAFEVLLGKREHGGVYLTKHGLMDSFTESDAKKFDENLAAVTQFAAIMAEGNVRCRVLISPTGTQVYADELPAGCDTVDSAPYFEALKSVPSFVDVRETFASHEDEALFYKTDHHWTSRGAYLAYAALKESLGEEAPSEDSFEIGTVTNEFYGTLYSRFALFLPLFRDTVEAPADAALPALTRTGSKGEKEDSLYAPDKLEGKDKYLYFLGGNDSIIEIETAAGTGRSLILVKDSYANAFLPYLARDYDRITVIDLRYFAQDLVTNLVRQNGYTDALVLYNLKSFASDTNLALLPLQ